MELTRWVLYLGVPLFFYKVATAENIYWWYEKVDKSDLTQVTTTSILANLQYYGMRAPEEHYSLDKAAREERAKRRDERIARKLAKKAQEIEATVSAPQVEEIGNKE